MYDCWLSLADAADRVMPFGSVVDMVKVAVAKDSFSDEGRVKVRTAMIADGLAKRREAR